MNSKQWGFAAWLTGIVALVYLGGASYALATGQVSFKDFSAAIGIPLGPLIGWVARGFVQ